MNADYFWLSLDGINLADTCGQQNGATCHSSSKTLDLSTEKSKDLLFPEAVSSSVHDRVT